MDSSLYNHFLPITAVVAIFLFMLKEGLEYFRKRSERKRKILAIKLLLAEELELNHWSFHSMFKCLTEIHNNEEDEEVTFFLETTRNGTELFRLKDWSGISGRPIPKFHTDMYEKLLPTLAELDQLLFDIVRKTYVEIKELEHYREALIDFLSGYTDFHLEGDKAFLAEFANERDDSYQIINDGYKALTGNDLKIWKLR